MPPGPPSSLRVAIVGASTLLGKELKQVLEDRNFPSHDLVLLDTSVAAGTLTEAGGEPTFIRTLAEDSFEGARVAFFAGSQADTLRNWEAAQDAGATVIDLTGAISSQSAASRHAKSSPSIPALESIFPPTRPTAGNGSPQRLVYSSPSSGVIIACTLAVGLAQFVPSRVVAVLYPPVSERGEAGVAELEAQTAALLSFREIEKPVFDQQVAFDLVTEYGPGSLVSFGNLARTAAQEVAQFLAGRIRPPAMHFVQAPTFYGYAFSGYAEVSGTPGASAIAEAFSELGAKVVSGDEPTPSNVSVAGESEIRLARIVPDVNVPEGIWLWGAADNLRLAATNAARIAENLIAKL